MVNYNCEKCSFTTYLKTDYLRHLNKKRPCDAVMITKPKTTTFVDNSYNVTNITNQPNNNQTEIDLLKQEIINMNKTIIQQQEQINMLFKMLNQSSIIPQPIIVQPAPEPVTIKQVPQPITIQEVPKPNIEIKVNKKDKAQTLMEKEFNNAVTMNEFINTIKIEYHTLNKIFDACGKDKAVKFSRGIADIFLEKLKELPKDKQPVFCTDLSRKTINLNQSKYTIKKEVAELLSKYEVVNRYGEDELEKLDVDEETGKYIIYSETRMFEENTEWIKYDNTSNYDEMVYFLNGLQKKVIAEFKKRHNTDMKAGSIGKDTMSDLMLLTTNVKQNINKIVYNICNEIYIEDV